MPRHHHPHGHDRSHGSAATTSEITGWVAGSLPADLYASAPTIEVDHDEILVVGDVGTAEVPDGLDAEGVTAAEGARIAAFRERTRDARIAVAQGAERTFGRPISWGATSGATTVRFTTVHAPVGTRLGFEHRALLDALVQAGVARNRPEALAWCVELVARNETEWVGRLQGALADVAAAAADAPTG